MGWNQLVWQRSLRVYMLTSTRSVNVRWLSMSKPTLLQDNLVVGLLDTLDLKAETRHLKP